MMEQTAAALGLDIAREAGLPGLSQADIARLMHRCAACPEHPS
jgi:hypothetical protein